MPVLHLWEQEGERKWKRREIDGRVEVVFEDVSVLGPTSKNRHEDGEPRQYLLSDQVAQVYEGQRVNIDHERPDDPYVGPSVERLAGVLQGLYFDEGTNRIRAKELIVQETDRTRHTIQMMQAQPQHVGMSHDAAAIEQDDGLLLVIKCWSIDIVNGPATNRGLYESQSKTSLLRVSAEELDRADGGVMRVSDAAGRWFYVSSLEQGERGMSGNSQEGKPTVAELQAKLEAEKLQRESAERQLKQEKKDREAADARAANAESAAALQEALADSKLPEASVKHLREQLKDRTPDEIRAGVKAHADYLKSLGVKEQEKPRKNVVEGAGPEPEGGSDSEEAKRIREQVGRDYVSDLCGDLGFGEKATKELAGIQGGGE